MKNKLTETTVNKNIRKIWESSNLSQQKFAEVTEIGYRTLQSLINSKTKVNALQIRNILLAFPNVNARWLILGEGQMKNITGESIEEDTKSYEEEGISFQSTNIKEIIRMKDETIAELKEEVKFLRSLINNK